jgi:cyclic pyranopterin phosphate synthase
MSYDFENDRHDDEKKSGPAQPVREGGRAVAEGHIVMNSAAFQAFLTTCAAGGSETWTQVRLAGIQAAKRADELTLIPNSIGLTGIELQYTFNESERKVTIRAEVRTRARISAETAALTSCGIAMITLVNSLRAIDRGMSIENLRILRE